MNDKKNVVILGAGIGGLTAGYYLAKTNKYKVIVLEKESVIGGICGSFKYGEFMLDYGAHKLYSVIPGILDDIREIMHGKLLKIPKKNRLFLKGHLLDYPLRLNSLASALGPAMFFKLGTGYANVFIRGIIGHNTCNSYEDYIIQRFGRPAYEIVFQPLADKVWGEPASLHTQMAVTRVPASGGLDVILKLLGIKKDTAETNAPFFYYPRNGFIEFPSTLREHIDTLGGKVITDANIEEIQQSQGKMLAVNCKINDTLQSFPCDLLISSIPLQDLGNFIFNDNHRFKSIVDTLQFRHLIIVYIFVKKSLVLRDQWIFFPEKEIIFSRIFEQKQMNPELCPQDQTSICCDFTCSENSLLWQAKDEDLVKKCIDGLVNCGFISPDEVTDSLVKRKMNFYPRYDYEYEIKMDSVINELKQASNLLLTGRIGMYNYNNADHCMDMGRFIADSLSDNTPCPQIIDALIKHTKSYRIVD